MSKLDVGVGDEFPLDEDSSETVPHHGDPHEQHWRRREFRRPHHGHHHHHHFGALPLLLVLGGVAALIVAGKISATTAFAMIGLGVAFLGVLIFSGVRRFRRLHQHPPGQA